NTSLPLHFFLPLLSRLVIKKRLASHAEDHRPPSCIEVATNWKSNQKQALSMQLPACSPKGRKPNKCNGQLCKLMLWLTPNLKTFGASLLLVCLCLSRMQFSCRPGLRGSDRHQSNPLNH